MRSFLFVLTFFAITSLQAQTIRYVKPTATGTGDGSSWANASGNLQAMINASDYNDEIWVAEGTYQPIAPNSSFGIAGNIKLFGSFPATGAPGMADRNFSSNETILQGKGNASVVKNDYYEHSSEGVIDGFIIQGGGGSGGGGIYNWGASPTISNCVIRNNTVSGNGSAGGGVHNAGNPASNPTFINCIFYNNAAERGGAIYNNTRAGSIIKNCHFLNNHASLSGGAIQNYASTVTIQNSIFHNNSSSGSGGAIANFETSNLNIYNSLFYKNTAASWCVIINGSSGVWDEGGSILTIVNSSFEGNHNSSSSTTAAVGNFDGNSATIYNSIFWNNYRAPDWQNNTAIPAYGSNITASNNLTTQNPLFVDAANGNYQLQTGSPAINAGSNSFYLSSYPPDDLAGNQRIFNTTIDMGAYEFGSIALPATFGPVSASIKNGQLLVNWATETETNNSHFEIMASTDGNNFHKIGTVQSKARDGNSARALQYEFSITENQARTLAAVSLLGLMAIGCAGWSRRRKIIAMGAMLLLNGALFYSCAKRDVAIDRGTAGKLFIKIVQVDKDGTTTAGRAVQAVTE